MCLEAGRIAQEDVRLLTELQSSLDARNLALCASPLVVSSEGGQDQRRKKCFGRRVPRSYVFRHARIRRQTVRLNAPSRRRCQFTHNNGYEQCASTS